MYMYVVEKIELFTGVWPEMKNWHRGAFAGTCSAQAWPCCTLTGNSIKYESRC
jgi:hypothetical protein